MSDNESFDFSSLLPKRGAFKSLSFELVRELTPDDILRVGTGSLLSHKPLQSIRAIHHRMAQLLAQGYKAMEVAKLCSSSTSRISKLQADPAFQELLSYYNDQMTTAQIEDGERIHEKLKSAAETALDELNHRLEDEELRTAMPVGELRKIVEMGGDRTVSPPKASVQITTNPTQITLNIGAPRFAESNKKPQEKTIEHVKPPIDLDFTDDQTPIKSLVEKSNDPENK
jgi:hypothetical protein